MRCAGILVLIVCLDTPITADGIRNQASPSAAEDRRLAAAVDVPRFCCPDYLPLITDRIRVNWNVPTPAKGTTVLRLTIRRDGRTVDSVIEKSSGDATRDSSAQRAVAGTRLPPLPGDYPDATLTIHITFESGAAPGSLRDALRNLERYRQDAAGGQAFGPEIQFDTKGVEFGPWIRRFVAQVKRNWFVPYAAMSKHGHVVITFNVQKSGTITDVEVYTPSAVDAFNNAARGAIIASTQTYPLPREYPAEQASFTVTFYYNEVPPPSERTLQPNTSGWPVPDLPLPDEPASSLLKAGAADVEHQLGKPSQIDGRRWTYRTSGGNLAVYFDEADVVTDIQPGAFELSIFKK